MASNLQTNGGQAPRPAGSTGPPQNFGPPMPMQFRPMVPAQQFMQPGPQQFRPMVPAQQFPPPAQQALHSSQPVSMPYSQPTRPLPPPSYTFGASYQYPPGPQLQQAPVPPGAVQPWAQSVPLVTSLGQPGQQPSTPGINAQANSVETAASDWQEHASGDGKKYYYNKKTKQSSWEKPLELMSPIERADASTEWKEFTTPEGRKYFYNKVTKQSKWTIPDELKMARELAEKSMSKQSSESGAPSLVSPVGATGSSPVGPAVTASPLAPTAAPTVVTTPVTAVTPQVTAPNTEAIPATVDRKIANKDNQDDSSVPSVSHLSNGASAQDLEEAKKAMPVTGKINITPVEEKTIDDEPLVYTNKLEAKNAFKALLESANVESDWTWDQAMRVIINDKRYGALKTLGERKQAFNEYLGQRKKQEAEERRMKQKKAREDFTKMLQECKELTSTTRWSKAVSMFEGDERFSAVERARDREDLFESYLVDLQKKERARAAEEHKRNIAEYRAFLESCDFIKVNTQWRKVQDRLEDDERCARLEKIDRLEIFQEYVHDLEKEEEEQRRMQKEQVRKQERKNRDEFRKMMEGHVACGILTAKMHWRDYCMQVKDSPTYIAVAANTSGSTPKDLFEDVAEELERQYNEDKSKIKEATKFGKITLVSSSTLENFKSFVLEHDNLKGISDTNLKLVFEELMERIREKEEKEAKKRQRLGKSFSDLLHSIKDISVSSTWEDFKSLFEDSQEYRAIGDYEGYAEELFEQYITHLKDKQKEKERIREEEKAKKEREREEKERKKEKDKERREKEKDRKEKEREREKDKGKDDSADVDAHGSSKDRKREKDKDKDREKDKDKDRERKHRKRHHDTTTDDGNNNSDKDNNNKEEREDSKKSRRHSSDRKKSRKHGHGSDSESESRHRKHSRKDRDGSRRTNDELEDGELGEDGEIR